MPPRRMRARAVGEHEDFIREEDAANAEQVCVLGDELGKHFTSWGKLSVEIAANVGLRWGEQFQLTTPDVHLDGCGALDSPHVHVNFQIDAGADAGDGSRTARLAPSTGRKTRIVGVSSISFTGYGLHEALAARVAAANAEKRAGYNPDSLLFPAQRGGMIWHSAFSDDHLHPAMKAAAWPTTEWYGGESEKVRTVYHLTWHSLRHRFARIAIDTKGLDEGELMEAGGWENIATVQNRYYRSGQENMRSAI